MDGERYEGKRCIPLRIRSYAPSFTLEAANPIGVILDLANAIAEVGLFVELAMDSTQHSLG